MSDTNFQIITSYVTMKDANAAIAFYKKAFGATEDLRIEGPGGKIGHAGLTVYGGKIMMSDEMPGMSPPPANGSSSVNFYVMVDNPDQAFEKAVKAGATEAYPVSDKFYGHRVGAVKDPFGYVWHLAKVVEELSKDEMIERAKTAFTKG
ncbi:MAG TPA: VOC family protein [Alphaproteobacteria bacterium]|nr:VOC family protein [Alphaproteobacteria bacterium]